MYYYCNPLPDILRLVSISWSQFSAQFVSYWFLSSPIQLVQPILRICKLSFLKINGNVKYNEFFELFRRSQNMIRPSWTVNDASNGWILKVVVGKINTLWVSSLMEKEMMQNVLQSLTIKVAECRMFSSPTCTKWKLNKYDSVKIMWLAIFSLRKLTLIIPCHVLSATIYFSRLRCHTAQCTSRSFQ